MAVIDPIGLGKAMDKAGMSQRQLADTLDISLQYMCDITAGRRTLQRSPGLRRRIAGALDVPVHWIEQTTGTH